MRAVLTTDEVRVLEHTHPAELADGTLMQRAAFAVATVSAQLLRDVRGTINGAHVVVLAGRGNNAGDALYAAGHLARRGCTVDIVIVWESTHEDGLAAALSSGASILDIAEATAAVDDADLVIDGLVGIGASGALREPADALVQRVNDASALVVAVDVPSGVDADTGLVAGDAVNADVTVTFIAAKPGLVLSPGRECAGAVEVIDIGVGDGINAGTVHAIDALDVAAFITEPESSDHKYRRGIVGLAVGSPGYPGAAMLVAGAARIGIAGMATIDAEASVAQQVIARWPDVVSVSDQNAAARARVTAWVCGSGWPDGYGAERLASALNTNAPVVVDAGGVGQLANPQLRALVNKRHAPTIITPHEGELARLVETIGVPASEFGPAVVGRLGAARAVARELGVVVVLKGAGTVIAAPNGSAAIDTIGGSELAVAGSGDVLAGIVGAVLAHANGPTGALEDDEVVPAIAAGVWLHGIAGRLASHDGYPVSPLDLIDALPAAISWARRG